MNRKIDFLGQDLDFQQILTNPLLDIAARLWEDERYRAAKICYRSMRLMDDLVDDQRIIDGCVRESDRTEIEEAIKQLVKSLIDLKPGDSQQEELIQIIQRFQIPIWPWQKLSESMIYDIHHNSFRSLRSFLSYADGAAVAPAYIGMHLCGCVKKNKNYHPPQFGVLKAVRPMARFFNLVHIIRDFQKDQQDGLNYFSDDLMAENGLTVAVLRQIAAGSEISFGFRNLMWRYYNFVDYYRRKARQSVDSTRPYLEPRYQLSLELLYSLYLQIFERINVAKGQFTTEELNPSPDEVRERIQLVLSSFESC